MTFKEEPLTWQYLNWKVYIQGFQMMSVLKEMLVWKEFFSFVHLKLFVQVFDISFSFVIFVVHNDYFQTLIFKNQKWTKSVWKVPQSSSITSK